jgi:hypothetical protein
MADDKGRESKGKKPSPVQQVDDRGLASSEAASTTDKKPDSALGGGTATRSGSESEPNPAEERSE